MNSNSMVMHFTLIIRHVTSSLQH